MTCWLAVTCPQVTPQENKQKRHVQLAEWERVQCISHAFLMRDFKRRNINRRMLRCETFVFVSVLHILIYDTIQ